MSLERALVSGTIAAAAVALAVAVAGRRRIGSGAAPLNATSHLLWGDEAARHDGYSMKYTATGFAANHAAAIFWALFYEALPRRLPALARGAAVSALAYVVDYHVVPRRLTPGFELRLPRLALAPVYAALAAGLAARDLLAARRPPRRSARPGAARAPLREDATPETVVGWASTRRPRAIIRQAESDVGAGLEDTDCRAPRTSAPDCP